MFSNAAKNLFHYLSSSLSLSSFLSCLSLFKLPSWFSRALTFEKPLFSSLFFYIRHTNFGCQKQVSRIWSFRSRYTPRSLSLLLFLLFLFWTPSSWWCQRWNLVSQGEKKSVLKSGWWGCNTFPWDGTSVVVGPEGCVRCWTGCAWVNDRSWGGFHLPNIPLPTHVAAVVGWGRLGFA